jgi:hypothetical protein
MSPHRFAIENRASLLLEREIVPLAQHLARTLNATGGVRRITSSETCTTEGRWIVFLGEGEQGFGVKIQDGIDSVSMLQSYLEHVRTVQTIVKSMGGPRNFPFELSLERSPPTQWHGCTVEGMRGRLSCAASLPIDALPVRCVEPQRDPMVRIPIVGSVKGIDACDVGVSVVCTELDVWIPDLGIRAHGVCRGGEMTIEVGESEAVEQQHIPGVRLDLGEIEMRLSDLVGLRPGAVLNLGEVVLERCFIRLGATVLAEGRFASSEGKLMLTIDSVL